jgi:putative methionine-R-sulfoxide reductase with GAF domain/streptogramin lyase/anti-sigma regulatory factor (Ser/Thr protein kinase)
MLCNWKTGAQSNITFQHLNTTNGLSYIGVRDMCVDHKGNLWIGTGNGLNMFNGKTTDKYLPTEYPQLKTNEVVQVTCDSSNRIWVLTGGGNVTMIDEKRQMHRVGLYEKNDFVRTSKILNSKKHGIILYTARGNYIFKANGSFARQDSVTKKHFSFLPIIGFDLKVRGQVFNYDADYYLLIFPTAFLKVSYRTNTVDRKFLFPGYKALSKWGLNELLVYDRTANELKIINLVTEEVAYPFRGLKDQFGKTVSGDFTVAEKINEFQYLLGTEGSGIYIYDTQAKKIYYHSHNSADPTSIASNYNRAIAVGKKGWVFVTTVPNGISYFNFNSIVSSQYVFTDGNGKSFDGFIQGIATKDNNTYYLGTERGMVEWKRNSNTSNFIDFTDKDGKSIFRTQNVSSIVIDKNDRIWATTVDNGIIVMDKNRKLLKHFRKDTADKSSLKIARVGRVLIGPDGYIWLCGRNGISRINPGNYAIDNLENTPLQFFDSMHVVPLLFTDKDNLWISASFNGLYHYNFSSKVLKEVEAFKPYKNGGILDINADSSGNIYVANRSATGVKILSKNGTVKTIAQKDGLIMDWTEGLIMDKHNRMWIGNDIALACYNPTDSSLKAFDVRYGLSIYGFRVGSYYKAPNGEFVLGTPRGLQIFHPDSLYNKKISLNAQISRIETKNIVSNIDGSETFRLAAGDNQVTFHFSTVDFSQHLSTYYEYKLVDLDKDWIRIADQNSARYNSLPSGKYIFKVRISNDNKTWHDAGNEVTIIIAAPFYQTWWFKTTGLVLVFILIWIVFKYYQKKHVRQREQLETELVINYFASRINSHRRIEDILWDVAKNCISQLNFEDCVIYLLDKERNVLVQKAAWGPKMERDLTIFQPIEIPVGKGIVGAVAQSGKAELIGNTSADERYIADDAIRYSEIAVPLCLDDKVIGVIDSEHTRKNFFNQKHLNILSTIAVLCANQIQRAKTEEEKQQAKIEALETKQKVAESRLQSLRLQMNPHFLFNALNSIQQMILANEEMVATRYLSRFSKLLRTILIHSDKEMVTLHEELEILNLYVELEAIRFKDSFQYKIECDEDIDLDEVKVPTLLVQPFVENAIWHGLMHKEGDRKLHIQFFEKGDYLQCTIEDNGIGREMSDKTKPATGQGKKHISKGISVSVERLKTLGNGHGSEGLLNIVDLKDETGRPMGTRVEISFPILN